MTTLGVMCMNEIAKELNEALKLVSVITLSGDAVDVMALAKQKIRNAIAEAEKQKKE